MTESESYESADPCLSAVSWAEYDANQRAFPGFVTASDDPDEAEDIREADTYGH